MKKLGSLLVLFCFVLQPNAQTVTYSGPVEYHLEVTKTASGGGTDGGYDWNVSIDEKRIIEGDFFVTFVGNARQGLFHNSKGDGTQSFDGSSIYGLSGFSLADIKENILFINSVNNEGNDQKTSQPCYDDRLVFKHKATPGDARTQRTSVRWTRADKGKPVIESGQIMFRDKKYTLMLIGKMKVNATSETYSSITLPCLDTVIPPISQTANTTLDFPIVVSGEHLFDNPEILEGTFVQMNESGQDRGKCLGGLSGMAHGDMNCSYTTRIITSWTLVMRTEECDATISYLKGDVKINGVPATEGGTKVGAGDVIETGQKGSRMEIHLPGGETFRLGSKSRLVFSNPCNPSRVKPMSKGTVIRGLVYSVVGGGHADYDPNMRTGGVGVRGSINPELPLFYASADPDFVPLVSQQEIPRPGDSAAQPNDPEKEELIEGYQSLSGNQTAYFLDYEEGRVNDLTVLKGTIRVEDAEGLRIMEIHEGTTLNQWDDGTPMTEIVILTR